MEIIRAAEAVKVIEAMTYGNLWHLASNLQ